MALTSWMFQILIAVDQFFNACVGGYADETLSAHAYRQQDRYRHWRYMRVFIDKLFFFQDEHCFHAYLAELHRDQMPISERDLPVELTKH